MTNLDENLQSPHKNLASFVCGVRPFWENTLVWFPSRWPWILKTVFWYFWLLTQICCYSKLSWRQDCQWFYVRYHSHFKSLWVRDNLLSIPRWETRKNIEHKIDPAKNTLAEYDKIKRITFSVDKKHPLWFSWNWCWSY